MVAVLNIFVRGELSTEHRVPTKEEVLAYLKADRNWGRWGQDDQRGAVNLVTPEKRLAAARLVRKGRALSLSREFPKILPLTIRRRRSTS